MQALGLVYLLTIYDSHFRNGWWIVFTSQDQELAYAFIFAIGVVIIPEIATPGFEGVTYGAITTFQNCAQNISAVINNLILAIWDTNTSDEQLKDDTPTVRRNMAYLTVLAALIALSSLLVLPLLPSQKRAIAQLKLQPGSPLMGSLMVVFLVAIMLIGTIFSCLPIFPATACLVIAGGPGCGAYMNITNTSR